MNPAEAHDEMGRRAHGDCIDRAEYGPLMRATQDRVRAHLEEARADAGVSQQRLARVIGVNREAMRDRLLGRTQLKAEEVAALAAFFGRDIGDFFAPTPPG